MRFKGYLVREKDEIFSGSLEEIDTPSIESGRVLIKVHYSSLNYKDALAASGAKGVVKSYPFVPGIDVAGEIIESMSPDFSIGDNVLATGYKIGMSEFGGFGEIVHLPSEWVIKLPAKLDFVKAMSYGTAGITAAACIWLNWRCWISSRRNISKIRLSSSCNFRQILKREFIKDDGCQ